MAERINELETFLHRVGWENAKRGLLAADASFRSYDRLKASDGTTAVLMDAPPPMEDVRPFVKIDRQLEKLGLGAPHITAIDQDHGFLLLEDLGDNTYTNLLKKGADEYELYEKAVDVLVHINGLDEEKALPSEGLPPYDDKALIAEATLLTDWYMPAVLGTETDKKIRDDYINRWLDLFPVLRELPETLVLRDYHVDNLMMVNGKEGLKACGLLDFQDGLQGPMIYDLVSLLEDARRDIDENLIAAMKQHYFEKLREQSPKRAEKLQSDLFDCAWSVLAAQRHAKVIGIFTRLCVRDDKSGYLHHIPRLWRMLERACAHPALRSIKEWLDKHIPPEKRIVPPCP